jgi:hypothetical protein
MRGIWTGTAAALLCAGMIGTMTSAQAESTAEFTVGSWSGYSYTDSKSQFTDCAAWTANRDNIQLGVDVTGDWKLQLWLYRKNWSLPQDTDYPISYWIDRDPVHNGRVKFYNQENAFIDVDAGNDVFEELKAGTELTIRTAKYDYIFELNGSRAALSRLVDCVDRNTKAADSNPFGPGTGNQQNQQQQPTQQQPDQQSNQQQSNQQSSTQQGGSTSSSDDTLVKDLTVSPDQVQGFLVEVTGAKPSMIKVVPKKDKAGAGFYDFTTPLGGGEFWQEKLGGDQLQDVAAGYVADYHKQCKGDFEETPNKPVQGQHGQLASGTAACSSSPYQDNGPEFLSYEMTESDGMVSVYITYTGGNAAKAKSDSLGHLIEQRDEDLLRQQN